MGNGNCETEVTKTHRYVKRVSVLLHQEMQIKVTMGQHLTLTNVPIFKTTRESHAAVEKGPRTLLVGTRISTDVMEPDGAAQKMKSTRTLQFESERPGPGCGAAGGGEGLRRLVLAGGLWSPGCGPWKRPLGSQPLPLPLSLFPPRAPHHDELPQHHNPEQQGQATTD